MKSRSTELLAMQKENTLNLFRTTDIILASVLRLSSYPLVSIETEGQKGTFVFEGDTSRIVKSYNLGQITIEPVEFYNMVKQLTTSVKHATQQ